MTVAELLQASRSAHSNMLQAKRDRRSADIRPALDSAYDLRTQAHNADPDHTDPAWADDVTAKFNHSTMIEFYERQIARG